MQMPPGMQIQPGMQMPPFMPTPPPGMANASPNGMLPPPGMSPMMMPPMPF